MKKKKCFVLMVSRVFPATHPKRGELTFFAEKIILQLIDVGFLDKEYNHSGLKYDVYKERKKHTIRGNYPLWKKRIDMVDSDEAYISVRQWEGAPYKSKQIERFQLHKGEVGIEKLSFHNRNLFHMVIEGKQCTDFETPIAENDGLSDEDFIDWFKGYDLSEEMAIIHFTDFRYKK